MLLDEESSGSEIEQQQQEYYDNKFNYQSYIIKLRALIINETKHNTNEEKVSSKLTGASALLPKLPCIQLPVFSGDITEYEAFIDQFEARIGNRPDLEDVTKLQYLKTQFKGRAHELIKGYSSISDNYQSALDTLKETYGDTERLKHCLLQKIVSLESPKHNKGDLETFRVAMLNLTRSLSNKHDYSCCEWIIASLFQHKLCTATIRQLYLKYETNYFDLSQLSEGLRDMVSHMEMEGASKLSKWSKSEGANQVSEPYKGQNIGTYNTTTGQLKSNQIQQIVCRFCGGAHRDAQCTKYPTGGERIQQLKERKLCTRCMGPHPFKSCNVKLQLCRRCRKGIHHTTLCKTFDKPGKHTNQSTTTAVAEENSQTGNNNQPSSGVGHVNVNAGTTTTRSSGVALATALAQLEKKGEERDVQLFFDTGSQKTFITRKLVEEIRLPIKETVRMTITGFMGQPKSEDFHIVKPMIKMGRRRKRVTAVVVEELPPIIVVPGLSEVLRDLSSKGFQIAKSKVENDRVGNIDLLIGCDYYYDFISNHTISHEGIHLLKSPAGYIITGKLPDCYLSLTNVNQESLNITPESVLVMKITDHIEQLQGLDPHLEDESELHKLWDLDSIGIDATKPIPDDSVSYQAYLDTVKYEDGQYWIKLPWRMNKADLPNNYYKALGQMYSLIKEQKRKGQIEAYQKVFDEHARLGFIEEVPMANPTDQCPYLPHHGVLKDSETTPLRIVFNCSSKSSSHAPSLNDCLMTGPTMTKKLYDVLLKFRINKYAYTADISKAFLRVGLQEEDRDYTRFVWLSDPNDETSPIKTYRFKSVLFGATSSPFLLQATIDYHLKTSDSPLKEVLASNFYVDNFQGTASEEWELISIYREANKQLKVANMPLRQWTTNNPNLQCLIN
ncbi:hypothetical protein Pcinc_002118 [Petrolisthes cinctipes]|uniref:DUF1758 domain-containing protein n=1 Tax=Petrolisthes cinctipes TaxID=88211 RepID=A0AAE1L2J0_PETCI|nr:hypothetical protein Pcinc_002118 [Petrolisthes cinctipes]